MIGFIRGKILEMFKSGKAVTSLVLWINDENSFGLGYTVLVSEVHAALYSVGYTATLWTYLVHNENDNYLLGF
ncbi:hypothetical protein IT418_01305, partial [bacterium]|nr:hypothetical protein [bacterium]